MDATTLTKLSLNISPARAQQLLPGLLLAWKIAEVNTVERRAMWFAQVLEESVGLSATTEYASGSEYEGRADLGNNQPGDGTRFKGRGFIQLTGRHNYGAFSQWCYDHGLVPNNHYFIDNPQIVANDEFAWVSAAFYWVGDHGHGYRYLNAAADARDIVAATYMVNGGQNGIDIRRYYYQRALNLGNELLGGSLPPTHPNWSDMATQAQIEAIIDRRIRAALFGGDAALTKAHPIIYPDANNGVFDKLIVISTRLNNQLAAIKGIGGKANDTATDVTVLQKAVASVRAAMAAK